MEEIIDKTIEAFSASVPRSDNEYLNEEDGLLHCSVCHAPTQTIILHPLDNQERKVHIICKCKEKELEARKEIERQQALDRKRQVCFEEANMKHWTFENDDRKCGKLSDAMERYADNFAEYKKSSQGLLLYGPCGTGKTYLAAAIANRLIDNGYDVFMTNFARLTNKMQELYKDKQKYIDSLNFYPLLIIDDLGAERDSDYMQEQVYNIIDARYRSGLPFIITTNLTAEELKKPQDIGHSRIYDRVLERCLPVEVSGSSRRRQKLKDTAETMREQLGL